jgi:D-alanyl-D-alanine carboxypeptidase
LNNTLSSHVSVLGLAVILFTPLASADDVDRFLESEMKKRHLPGLSLAVVKEGKIVKTQGYGHANIELRVPATPETVYQLASVTKQFVAAGILLLMQNGKIRLDDPVTRHVAGLPDTWKPIAIRHLLNHTSGLPKHQESARIDLEQGISAQSTA